MSSSIKSLDLQLIDILRKIIYSGSIKYNFY